jgi:hypothetical protein
MAPRSTRITTRGDAPLQAKVVALLCLLATLLALAGCEEPRPRTFTEFMEDDFAREGTLARCNQDRAASAGDLECANARRAAMAIALNEERVRREELEAESERLRAELRARIAQQQEAERRAREAAEAMERLAYEAQWVDSRTLELPEGVDLLIEQVEQPEARAETPSVEP